MRYQRQWPGELIHLDSKKLGRIAGIGHRITGRAGGTVNRHHGIGWEALHVCIDDATRLGYSEILPDERKGSAVGFLERALGWFAQHGVTVERLMTDNGSASLSQHFRAAVAAAGLKHKRTKPYTPRTNGKAERFIQTSLREWAYAQAYPTSQERIAALAPWLDHYNTARPHAGLGNGPPAARLRQLQLLCSTQGTVASSRPASINDRCGGPGQGSPKATGGSRRAALCRAAGRDEGMVLPIEQRDVAIDLNQPVPGPTTNLLNLTHTTRLGSVLEVWIAICLRRIDLLSGPKDSALPGLDID